MASHFKTGTALVASLALVWPQIGTAQTAEPTATPEAATCPDGRPAPCVPQLATESSPEPGVLEKAAKATDQAAQEAASTVENAKDAASDGVAEAEKAAEAAIKATEEKAKDAEAAAKAGAVKVEKEADQATDATKAATEDAVKAVEADLAAKEAKEKAEKAKADPVAPAAVPATAPTTDAKTTDAKTDGKDSAKPLDEAKAAPEQKDGAPKEPVNKEPDKAETGKAGADQKPTASSEAAPSEKAGSEQPAPEQASPEKAGEKTAPPPEVVAVPEAEATQTEAAAAAATQTKAPDVAALDASTKTEAEVKSETITAETARSSAQDFATTITGETKAEAKSKGGLSNFEKAALLGLGAVAVGAVLSNNRRVELNSGDRVVVTRPDGSYEVIKDDVALFRQPGATVATENFKDGSTRTTITYPDGSKVVTVRDSDLRVLRRAQVAPDGTQTVLIDETVKVAPVDVAKLPAPMPVAETRFDEDGLRAALAKETRIDRGFSLAQIRNIAQVRALVAPVDIPAITFATGSAAISPDQAKSLAALGRVMQEAIAKNPKEMFLIEGHTDAVGSAASNLALSDRRAESVALALHEYFGVPTANMVVQGYGEAFLKVRTEAAEARNRRASVRRITDLLAQ